MSPVCTSLPTAYCLLPAAYCLLPTAYCLLPTAYFLLVVDARDVDAPIAMDKGADERKEGLSATYAVLRTMTFFLRRE